MSSTAPGLERSVARTPLIRRSIASALIGNFIEFFDFAAYGFLAASIGATFFPTGNPTTQLLSSFAAFGVSFFFRPVGGAFFGALGDRFGRKISLTTAIILMSLATGLVGVLPTYAAAGPIAPVLLVLLRCLQGMSVGGEFAGSSTFIVEYSRDDRRGLWSSLVSSTSAIGTMAGSLVVLLLTSWLPATEMAGLGWRIPFLIAFPLGFVGLYMRLKLEDTPVFKELARTHTRARNPLVDLTARDWVNILIVAAASGASGLGFYFFSTYINTYLSVTGSYSRGAAILLSVISLAFYAALCPLAGHFSDRFGRKATYVIGCFGLGLLAVPIFMLLGTGFGGALVGLLIYAIPQAMINTMVSLVVTEMFAAKTRVTGGAIANNFGVGLLAGTGPFIATALLSASGNVLAPAYFLGAVIFAIGILLAFTLPETYKRELTALTGAGIAEKPQTATPSPQPGEVIA